MRFSLVILIALAMQAPAQNGDHFADELKLKAAGMPADGPGLLAFFKARTSTTVEPEKLTKLITALSDKDENARTRALHELVGIGPLAVPVLREAVNDPDTSTANALARQALETIQGENANQNLILAARVLARFNPAGSTQVLMGFLPFTENDEVGDELKRSLLEVGFDAEGKPDAAVLKALTDEQAVRRAAAAEILGQRGAEPRDALIKLLADPRGLVRLRASLALTQVKEPKAVETLISLLNDLPLSLGRDAEDYLLSLAAEQSPKAPIGPEADSRKKASDAWQEWWKKSEGASVLDEFKKRTMSEENRETAMALIKKLGEDDFKVRQGAEDELKKMGVVVVPLLRKVLQGDAEAEIKTRAKECITAIEKVTPGSLSPVYARLAAFRKPASAVEVLLNFLPFADEDVVLGEVQSALNALATQGGKNIPPLLAALRDKASIRRAVAAEALCSAGPKELDEARKLLKDTDPLVRVRVAMALINVRDKEAVPQLIAMLPDAPTDQVSQIEDLLARLAGEDALAGQPGSTPEEKKKRAESWAAWWTQKGSKVSLGSLLARGGPERQLGLTLIISPNQSRVSEIGPDGKVRWEIQGLSAVWDAQFIGRSRILLLEPGARRVTERTLRGDVLWEMSFNNIYPTGMQRLSNGNLLLVSNNRLVEMTRSGKETFSFTRPNGDILHARKLRDGSIVYVTSSSTVHRIDGAGKELKNWRVNGPSNQGCDILPNGNVVFPQQWGNRVYEFDTNGRQVWTGVATQPTSVARLPNGNTLVGSNSPYQVVELDRTGREVWKVTVPIQPLRILRR